MGELFEVKVRDAIYVMHMTERLLCKNKPEGSSVPGICIRTKDIVGNTYTLDITHSAKILLRLNGKELTYDTGRSICSRLNGQTILIDKDHMTVANLDRYIPNKGGLLHEKFQEKGTKRQSGQEIGEAQEGNRASRTHVKS